jgi:hypothetical protein
MSQPRLSDAQLDALQEAAFAYFLHEVNPSNGLIADSNRPDAPASIAAIGLGLSAYPVGVERGFMTRAEAVERTLATLRFFSNSPQGTQADATGYKGWVHPWHLGLNQGPIVLMIENYRSGLFWRLSRQCPYLAQGLRRAGFTGGWL